MTLNKPTKAEIRKHQKKEQARKDKAWADEVKQRFDGCIVCGDTKRLNAHHIIPREIKEFRHELANGIALCPKHHRFSFKFSAHQNPFIFYGWLSQNYPDIVEELVTLINRTEMPLDK